MVDLDDLENLVSNFRANIGGKVAIELITRLRQAENDAARYRWLKEQLWFECEAEWNMPINLDADGYSFSEVIDAVIDEAVNASNN